MLPHLPNEILYLIFGNENLDACDLPQLTGVSKDWHALWENIYALPSLIKLIPEDAWCMEEGSVCSGRQLTLTRALTEKDWEAVYKRSCLVKTLEMNMNYTGFRSHCLAQPVAEAIVQHPPAQRLLPNLRHLHFNVYSHPPDNCSPVYGALLHILLSPTITSLSVPCQWANILADPLSMAGLCNTMEDIRLESNADTTADPETHTSLLVEAIDRWTHLRTVQLEVVMCDPTLLLSLSRKSALETLDLHFCQIADDYRIVPPYRLVGFPSLWYLALRGGTAKCATAVIGSWKFWKLERLTSAIWFAGIQRRYSNCCRLSVTTLHPVRCAILGLSRPPVSPGRCCTYTFSRWLHSAAWPR